MDAASVASLLAAASDPNTYYRFFNGPSFHPYWPTDPSVAPLPLPPHFPKIADLRWAVLLALVFAVLRWLLNATVFSAIGSSVMRLAPPLRPGRDAPPAQALEAFGEHYREQARLDHRAKKKARNLPGGAEGDAGRAVTEGRKVDKQIALAKACKQVAAATGTGEREARQWWRRVKGQVAREVKLKKWNEAAWQLLLYSVLWTWLIRLLIVDNAPWYHNPSLCYERLIEHVCPPGIFLYYLVQLAVYLQALASHAFDVKRKDFWEMFVHHLVTTGLIAGSYLSNQWRIGTLVLLVHDGSDILLQLAKLLNYAGCQLATDLCFVAFALSFAFLRLYAYPRYVISTVVFDLAKAEGTGWGGYYFYCGFLLVLQLLHVLWFSIILKMALLFLRTGAVAKDDRSETEPSDDEPTHNAVDARSVGADAKAAVKRRPAAGQGNGD